MLPLALVAVLRGVPSIDERWENTPAHFWLVLATGLICVGLGLAITENGRQRRDARLFLVGLAFVVSSGFLGLHALATPGVILAGKNAGFVLATPIGLVAAGAFAAASAVEFRLEASLRIVRNARRLEALVLAVIVAWAAISAASLPPLHHAVTPAAVGEPLGAVAAAGVVAFAFATAAYFRLFLRRGGLLALAVACGFGLLAEALVVVVVSLPTSWQLSWWEWHTLMLLGFGTIALAARHEWHEERFSALYLDETLHGRKEVTVLFADLVGFTPFSERRDPAEVYEMLVAYFGALAPMIRDRFEGEVAEFVGDQIFAVFNKAGDQPDHAVRAAAAALALQRAATEIAAGHPGWPSFRVGVNTGDVLAGVVGERGHRIHGVFGDTVNLGARLEGQAPPGGVVIGAATREQLPLEAECELLPDLRVKGKSQPVAAYLLRSLPPS